MHCCKTDVGKKYFPFEEINSAHSSQCELCMSIIRKMLLMIMLPRQIIWKHLYPHSDKGLASVSRRGMDDTGESMMMTPEEKLTQYDSRAKAFADTQQVDL